MFIVQSTHTRLGISDLRAYSREQVDRLLVWPRTRRAISSEFSVLPGSALAPVKSAFGHRQETYMHLNPVLVDDLDDLTAPLDLDDADVSGVIQLLEDAAELAVPSLLGWKLNFTIQGQPLSVTSIHPLVDTGDV